MQRIAPATGYDFPAKEEYRNGIWRIFREIHGSLRYNAHVLFLPSSEGIEIAVAREAGYRFERMHIVDRNPAIVASLKRRYPAVSTYGIDVDRAVERVIKKKILLDGLHLDLCGNVGESTVTTLFDIANTLSTSSTPLVAVNMLRGRERADWWSALETAIGKPEQIVGIGLNWFKGLSDSDQGRLSMIWRALGGRDESRNDYRFLPVPVKHGIYKSTAGNQTMLWCVFLLAGRDASVHWSGLPLVNRIRRFQQ